MDTPRPAFILGIPLHCVTMDEAVQRIAAMIDEGSFHLVVTLGTEMVMNARTDAAFREVACGADLLVPDTIGVVWAARRQGFTHAVKVAGVELLQALAAEGARRGWRFFLLGGKPGVADEAAARLAARHPGLVIAGTHHGYFHDDAAVVDMISAARPDVLLAALGSPRQETWSRRWGNKMGVAVSMGVGGSFDVLAGRSTRAPRWMIRLGLEWLYRLLREPRRVGRMLVLPRFVLRIVLGGDPHPPAPPGGPVARRGLEDAVGPGNEVSP